MKIYLVRHGQTAWNKQRRYQGSQDIPLDSEGVLQAEKLAERLKEIRWDRVISSDLQRARITAETVVDGKIEIELMPELREMHFGDWEGITFSEAEEKWPGDVKNFFADPTQSIIPNGENAIVFSERVLRGLEAIIASSKEEDTILITTHGGSVRCVLCDVLNKPLTEMWNMEQGNTAVNILEISKGKRIFSLINDTSHLG